MQRKIFIYLQGNFLLKKKFGLVSQLRRAMASVTANIAEGMSRLSTKEKKRMLNISYSSAIEVINFLILCLDLNLITEEEYLDLREKLECITNQLHGLQKNMKE